MTPLFISIGLAIAVIVGIVSVKVYGPGNVVEVLAEEVADEAIQAETGVKPDIKFDNNAPSKPVNSTTTAQPGK